MAARSRWTLKGFVRDEGGNITIESVIWLPVFIYLMLLITDVSLAFFGKAQAFRVMESGNRALSTLVIGDADDIDASEAAAETWIKDHYASFSTGVVVSSVLDEDNGVVETTMEIPARDLVLFNTLGVLSGWKITISTQQYVEWL